MVEISYETKIEPRFDLRAPPSSTGAGVPAEVAFATPFAKPHPYIELYTDSDEGSTVLDIPDMAEQGDGTMVFDFRLIGLPNGTAELAVDAAIELTEGCTFGRPY